MAACRMSENALPQNCKIKVNYFFTTILPLRDLQYRVTEKRRRSFSRQIGDPGKKLNRNVTVSHWFQCNSSILIFDLLVVAITSNNTQLKLKTTLQQIQFTKL